MSMEETPLFGEPVQTREKAHWVLSKRDEEDLARPRFMRYRGPVVPCGDQSADPRDRCRPAVWLRTIGPEETPVCARHKQDFLDRIALETPRGSQ